MEEESEVPEEEYEIPLEEFDELGVHRANDNMIFDYLLEWERDFREKYGGVCANRLYGKRTLMMLFEKTFRGADELWHYQFGVDVVSGIPDEDIDIQTEIEEFSENSFVYAIGSALPDKDGEPIYLYVDPSLPDNVVLLKFIPEHGDGEPPEEPPPQPAVELPLDVKEEVYT